MLNLNLSRILFILLTKDVADDFLRPCPISWGLPMEDLCASDLHKMSRGRSWKSVVKCATYLIMVRKYTHEGCRPNVLVFIYLVLLCVQGICNDESLGLIRFRKRQHPDHHQSSLILLQQSVAHRKCMK